MQAKLLSQSGDQRIFAVVLSTGDEVMQCLQRFVIENKVHGAQLRAIGAFSEVDLGYFDWQSKDYITNHFHEQVEVAALLGDVAIAPDGRPALHIHCVLGRRDGMALAGHLLRARVRPTLEVVLQDTPAHLRKRTDAESGLALIDLEQS